MNQKRKHWSPKPIPPKVVIPSFGIPEEDEMKLKEVIPRNKTLNLAIKYLEYSKDQLYQYVGDDEYARKSIRKWFPIDHFLSSIDEGKELDDFDILRFIKVIDDFIFQILDGVERSKKIEREIK
jgi:hypothetical protein